MNADAVRSAFNQLPALYAPDDFWTERQLGLRVNVRHEQVEQFLSWPSIVGTMFVAQPEFIEPELAELLAADAPRWQAVIGPEYSGYPNTNLIHQAYHLFQWERATGLRVSDLGSIVEIGGGYGALALVCHRAGFRGTYRIYDLPELSILQSFYLSEMGVPCQCVSDTGFKYRIEHITTDLLVAIYSLSETDSLTVDMYLKYIRTDHFLIGLKHGPWQGQDLNVILDGHFGHGAYSNAPHDSGSYYWNK